MFTLLLFFFPTFMSLIWAVQFMLRPRKNVSEKIFIALCLCSTVYFFAEANYISAYEDYKTFVIADALSQFARPLIPPFILMYLLSMVRGKCCCTWASISLGIAIVLGSISLCIYCILGIEGAATYLDMYDDVHGVPSGANGPIYLLHQIFCVYLYRAVIIGHSVLGICYVLWLCRRTGLKWAELRDFLFHGGDIEPQHLTALMFLIIFVTILVKFAFGRYFFLDHQIFAMAFVLARTILIYMTGFVCLYGRWATVNLHTMFSYVLPARTSEETESNVYIPEYSSEQKEIIQMLPSCDTADSDIIERINSAMLVDKLFLNAHITLEDLATHIGSNRTYISTAISRSMNTSFYDYVNSFRIRYAQEYMLRHPNATQEVIAEESGFANASAFNRKFKQVTQMTPRLWVLQNGN